MHIVCSRCRRILEYSGERPSFCAYCGASLEWAGGTDAEIAADPERTGPHQARASAETVEYRSVPGTAPPAGEHEIPGRVAGYRLIRKLGSGGMGTVFEAEDQSNGQSVAIKLIASDHVSSAEAVERFRQEGRLASAVTHPRCVFVLAVDDDRGRPYIVMELMPGTTLQTLVEREGPLGASSAILKIFDVIEGLQQFHQRGLIHRDVKPSNCFLEPGGRVKIGDFGLSKALEGGADLTRTGTFLGTPLYASPEQIKRDEVDERTDVYSVAATLYYLLSGRPPVQAADAAEALARIASEPAPPLRGYRGDIPRALEAAIHRGLERDPARRWRTLQEFHDSLVPFVPERLSIASVGLRVGAFVVDLALSYLLSWAIFGVLIIYQSGAIVEALRFQTRNQYWLGWLERILWFPYFPVLEGLGGASLGKWLVGLRVIRTDRGGPPGLARGLVRFLVFYVFTELPSVLLAELSEPFMNPRMFVRFRIHDGLIRGLGLLAVVSTMRQKSGFRGPHEWVSGTRVVRSAWRRRALPSKRLKSLADTSLPSTAITPAPDRIAQVGPYLVQGAVRWESDRKILLGQDSTLDRPVWIVFREAQDPPPSLARRSLNRRSRPRWIGGGIESEGRWDAFTAPSGVPLSDVVKAEALSWREVLPLLRELAEELQDARDDGTMPHVLSADQVWIAPDARVQLIDILDDISEGDRSKQAAEGPASPVATDSGSPSSSAIGDPDEHRALEFLGEVGRLALEHRRYRRDRPAASRAVAADSRLEARSGQPAARSGISPGRRIQAAVPEHARSILDRLTGVRAPFASLSSLRDDLEDAVRRPAEVTLVRRAVHLAIQGFFLLPGLALVLFISSGLTLPRLFPWDLELVVAIPSLWVLWAGIANGGMSFSLAGISLVRGDGQRAGRIAAGWRAFLVWAPPTILLAASRYVQELDPQSTGLAQGLWICAVLLLLVYVALALLFPGRGLQDRLAGTYLVPR